MGDRIFPRLEKLVFESDRLGYSFNFPARHRRNRALVAAPKSRCIRISVATFLRNYFPADGRFRRYSRREFEDYEITLVKNFHCVDAVLLTRIDRAKVGTIPSFF